MSDTDTFAALSDIAEALASQTAVLERLANALAAVAVRDLPTIELATTATEVLSDLSGERVVPSAWLRLPCGHYLNMACYVAAIPFTSTDTDGEYTGIRLCAPGLKDATYAKAADAAAVLAWLDGETGE